MANLTLFLVPVALLGAPASSPAGPAVVVRALFADHFKHDMGFTKAEIRGDVTRIPVIFTGNGYRRTVAVKLRNPPEGWRVDDLIFEDGRTFRSLLGK